MTGQPQHPKRVGDFEYLPEAPVRNRSGPSPTRDSSEPSSIEPVTVLVVDDDDTFRRSVRLALSEFTWQQRPLKLLNADSAAQAASVLRDNPAVDVVILDVVMETDDAGLRLVRAVREQQGNTEVRIVLVTGQPGVNSMAGPMDSLDISDFWLKTDLSYERLHGILLSNLRAGDQIRALSRARRGLQSIVEASDRLNRARGLSDFASRMLQEVSRVLGVAAEGVVCVLGSMGSSKDEPDRARVVAAAGRFSEALNQPIASLPAKVRDPLIESLTRQAGAELADSQVLFFGGAEDGQSAVASSRVAAYVVTGRALESTELELLRVFATHVNTGLINLALASRLDRLAFEDELLAIPNGNAMQRSLRTVIARSGPRNLCVMFLDLDQYAQSCLALGIDQGDLLLKKMARRLRRVFPPPTMIARLQGDTFVILGRRDVLRPERIDELESVDTDDPEHAPFISVSAARIDLDVFTGSERQAMAMGELLLQRARALGLSQIVEYSPGLEHETDRRFIRSRQLYHALHSDEIRIVVQPQVDLAGGRIFAGEALARWTMADGTQVPPNDFIPMAEANGLIVPLGRRVIELTCQALARLSAAGHGDIGIAVNVSALQLARADFMVELIDIAKRHDVAHERLELEITESTAMGEQQVNAAILHQLREAGFPITIDDFGTGYSSLGYLRTLPITKLKIDRSFIREIGSASSNSDQVSIADMMIQLGRQLDLRVLAEGVETPEQAAWLVQRGCTLAQGYLYGRPEPLDTLLGRLIRPDQLFASAN